MKTTLLYVSLLALTFCACKKKDEPEPITVIADPVSMDSDTLGQGNFTSYDHGLGGSALLYQETSGTRILRLYNFSMTAGPDVHVYLSKTSSYSPANVIELTKLTTGYSSSSINLPVNSTSYSADYKYALVYCVQYSSLFGYAELK